MLYDYENKSKSPKQRLISFVVTAVFFYCFVTWQNYKKKKEQGEVGHRAIQKILEACEKDPDAKTCQEMGFKKKK